MVLGSLHSCSGHDLSVGSERSQASSADGRLAGREEEVQVAVEVKQVGTRTIEYRWHDELILTTPGRVIFNSEVRRSLEAVVVGEAGVHAFINRTLSKRELDSFIAELVDRYGAHAIATVLDTIKSLAFTYSTQAGITISKNDIVIRPAKEILADYELARRGGRGRLRARLITEDERHEQIVNIWTETDTVADAMQANLHELNSIYMMANSGARIVQADPPARRHARPDGESEGRDHRAPDQGQLHGGPVGARVLHLHPAPARASPTRRSAPPTRAT